MDRIAEGRVPAITFAIGTLALILFLPALYDLIAGTPPGPAGKMAWFSASFGVAVAVFAFCHAHDRGTFGLMAAALIAGGAAKLWLTRPLWFPSLTFSEGGVVTLLAAATILAQAAIVLWGLKDPFTRRTLGDSLARLGPARLLALAVIAGLLSVSAMGYVQGARWAEFAKQTVAGGVIAVLTLTNIALLLHVPAPSVRAPRPIWLALAVLIASALLGWLAFQFVPHVEDEVAYLFQARTLQAGALAAPAPPEAAWPGLDYYLIDIRDGNWFAVTPPGWSAVLALGTWAALPWLVNPVLSAIILLLAYRVVLQIADHRRATIVAILMAASPWFIESSASLMPHNATLTFILLAWTLALAGRATVAGALLSALAAGLAMGLAFVTRQFDGLVIGVATGLWLLWRDRSAIGLMRTTAYGLGCIAAGSALLVFNAKLAGEAFATPLSSYLARLWHPGANAFGFGPNIGPPQGWGGLDLYEGHGPLEAMLAILNNLAALNLELFGWATGSVAALVAFILWARPSRADLAMGGLSLLLIAVLSLYWFSGAFYIGPRYWFGLFVPVVFLSAGGLIALWDRLATTVPDPRAGPAMLAVLVVFSLTVFVPWRGVVKYRGYQHFVPDIARRAATGEFGNDLVFVDTDAQPGSVLFLNDPWLPADKPVFLISQGPDLDRRAASAFPDRRSRHIELKLQRK